MVVDYYFREGFAAKHKINFLTIIFKVLLSEMLNFYLTKKIINLRLLLSKIRRLSH